MSDWLTLLISLSISGSILAVLLFSLKPFLKHKLSKSIQYYLWCIVLLRLMIPFSFESSIMNNVFYGQHLTKDAVFSANTTAKATVSSFTFPAVNENVANGLYRDDSDHSRYFKDLFSQYILYIWLLGVVISVSVTLIGYIRFLKYLKNTNKLASEVQHETLSLILNKRKKVQLVVNTFVTTPLLIGVVKPCIVLPDINYNEKQLKNILLHEITHLNRFDIILKWLTLLATSIHWFNPLMYFIKKEINQACELACDEAVIKSFTIIEKQDYGETLISTVSEYKNPIRSIQATMCEEKKALKERLIAIMLYGKKSKLIVVVSVILICFVTLSALYLGAGIGIKKNASSTINTNSQLKPNIKNLSYNLSEISKYKTPYVGNNSKASAIATLLPSPNENYNQKYISIQEAPNRLTIYYELKLDKMAESPPATATMYTNAMIVFSMIDNAFEITFAFRDSQSNGKLDETKYTTNYSFTKPTLEKKYNFSELGKNLNLLQEAIYKELELE